MYCGWKSTGGGCGWYSWYAGRVDGKEVAMGGGMTEEVEEEEEGGSTSEDGTVRITGGSSSPVNKCYFTAKAPQPYLPFSSLPYHLPPPPSACILQVVNKACVTEMYLRALVKEQRDHSRPR